MRSIACVMLALTLALVGCASQDEIEVQRCGQMAYIPDWNRCIESYNARVAAREVRETQEERAARVTKTAWPTQDARAAQVDNSSGENAAAWGLLGATAFMNGYNQSRPAITCWNYGPMTQCQ